MSAASTESANWRDDMRAQSPVIGSDTLLPAPNPYTAEPIAALQAIRDFRGPVLLDLDETLYLRNSTEDFIDTAWPGIFAFPIIRLIELFGPWRWTGGTATRDNWRVMAIILLFPWTLILWRIRAKRLARQFANTELVAAARNHQGDLAIVTAGFGPVVAPLIRGFGLPECPIICARPFVPADRRDGKLALARQHFGTDYLARSLMVTDSPDDRQMLDHVGRGIETLWPGARYRPAFAGLYVPGRYLSAVKRPGTGYIRRAVLQDDYLLWLLCSIPLAALPFAHAGGLLFLLLSFWAIYEQGYIDNDLTGARREQDPRLSAQFHDSELARRNPEAWIFAAICGLIGLWLTDSGGSDFQLRALIWGVVLVATHGFFLVFNRLDKGHRVWVFPVLQLARAGAFATVLPVMPVAVAAIGAYVMEKWLPYFLYRLDRSRSSAAGATENGEPAAWTLPLNTIRLMFFVILLAVSGLAVGISPLASWSTLALLILFSFKALRENGVIGRGTWVTTFARRKPVGEGRDAASLRDRPAKGLSNGRI